MATVSQHCTQCKNTIINLSTTTNLSTLSPFNATTATNLSTL